MTLVVLDGLDCARQCPEAALAHPAERVDRSLEEQLGAVAEVCMAKGDYSKTAAT